MSKDIWHTADITPEPCRILICKTNKGQNYTAIIPSPQEWNTIILPEFYNLGDIDNAERIEQYAYLDDLLACEQELIRTRKQLEESEKVSSAWEIQALDYKAENIALSGDLERTRKALEVAKERLKNTILDAEILATPEYLASRAKETLDEITALEQKD